MSNIQKKIRNHKYNIKKRHINISEKIFFCQNIQDENDPSYKEQNRIATLQTARRIIELDTKKHRHFGGAESLRTTVLQNR